MSLSKSTGVVTPSPRKRPRTDDTSDVDESSQTATFRRQVPARVKNSNVFAESAVASTSRGSGTENLQKRKQTGKGPVVMTGGNKQPEITFMPGVHIIDKVVGTGKGADQGDSMYIYYVLLVDGKVVDECNDKPFRICVGDNQMLSGNVDFLEGLYVG